MKKTSSELYAAHCTQKHGDGNWDWSNHQMYRNHFALKCRKGFFKSAEKVKNLWTVEESEYFENAEEFSPYIQRKRTHSSSSNGYNDAGDAEKSSGSNIDDIAKLIGGAIGVVIAVVMIVGFLKIVAGAASYSTYNSPTSSSSFGGYDSKKELEDAVRDAANALYDKCQIYGSSYDERCN